MSDPTRLDEVAGLEPLTASLRELPPTHAASVDRVVAAALDRRRRTRQRTTWTLRAASLLLAVGLAAGGVWYGRRSATPTAIAAAPVTAVDSIDPLADDGYVAPPGARVTFAAHGAGEEAPVTVTFTLHHPGARRVAVVGDFDDWSPTAEPMQRGPNGTWTTTVDVVPGRHGYAFVVDDTTWVTDPQAPVVRDPDYGRDHSVLVVGRP